MLPPKAVLVDTISPQQPQTVGTGGSLPSPPQAGAALLTGSEGLGTRRP